MITLKDRIVLMGVGLGEDGSSCSSTDVDVVDLPSNVPLSDLSITIDDRGLKLMEGRVGVVGLDCG